MNKAVVNPIPDTSRFIKSAFTLTFAIEINGIDVWHDCNEGWLDLGPCTQGIQIQYQLYPGQIYDLDILIWPHAVKIWCGSQYGWVRTWQFLERRWLTFSIRHVFPVRVTDFRYHIATVAPSFGMAALSCNAKNDKNFEVYLPPLAFGERRYFGTVLEAEESLVKFIQVLIINAVLEYIPASYLDGLFDIPQTVTDVRHQDAVLFHVTETILSRSILKEIEESQMEPEESKPKDRRESKMVKKEEKKKIPEAPKTKFEIKVSGDTILAGAGRIVIFETFGDRPPDLGEIIVLISSNNLPAQDDLPIIFVNVGNLFDVPFEHFKKLRISQLYTRWKIGDEQRDSEPQIIKSKREIKLNDHHVLPLSHTFASKITATFLDQPFEIQLRGITLPLLSNVKPKFFGYEKGDRNFGTTLPKRIIYEDTDILIAVTKIDAGAIAKGINVFMKGEYPLYPPNVSVQNLAREMVCTNDINAIRAPIKPNIVVKSHIILEAQMTLEVSLGLVGCRPQRLSTHCYSRLYCLICDTEIMMNLLKQIVDINVEVADFEKRDDFLTGFALDAGDVGILYVEGPRDGHILRVWEKTEDFHANIKPVFSSSARYSNRIYSDLSTAPVPFMVFKMYVPLSALLACPPVYARPAVPLPAKSAVLKLGRLVASKLRAPPCRSEMPTAAELRSLRLELCSPPRPVMAESTSLKIMHSSREQPTPSMHCAGRINWDK